MGLPLRGRLGRTCPLCGRPWRTGAETCPRCGFDPAAPPEQQWGLFTVFGYGLCGFVAGGGIGLTAAAATVSGPRLQPVAVLAVFVGGVLGLLAAAGIGRRLAPAVRCAYEHLLLALDGAGLLTALVAFSAPLGYEGLALIWLGTAAGVFWLLRRYGYRMGPAR